jgi:Protein of unknown function (DUF1217)
MVKDYSASLKRIANDPQVSKSVAYYKENIGKIKTSDDLMKDFRLYSYAMKAFGLEEMTYAKAFIKKVLDSDLTDTNSFANKLTDTRYRKFAAAFNFTPGLKVAQTGAQGEDTIGLYSNSLTKEDSKLIEDTAYYNINIDKITNVDQFLADPGLRTYALKSAGIDLNTSNEHLKKLLTSDLSDPDSYANKMPEKYITGYDADGNATYTNYPKQKFLNFAALYKFQTDGSVAENTTAQTAEQKKTISDSYILHIPSHITPAAMELNVDYLKAAMAKVEKVSDITGNTRLFDIVKTALGLPSDFLESRFENIVNSDLNDPENYALKMGGETYVAIVKLFNFGTDSKVLPGKTAQTEEQLQSMAVGYKSNYAKDDNLSHSKEDAYYKASLASIKTVDSLLNNDRLYAYIVKAYGFDPAEVTKDDIRKALTADRSQRGNFVDSNFDSRFATLADDFNFDVNGKIAPPKLAQNSGETTQIAADYIKQKTRFLSAAELTLAQTKAKEETSYFSTTIEKIKTVSELLADTRLVNILLVSKGIDPNSVTNDYLKKIFASDLDDPKSFANTETDTRFRDIAASFNFDNKGNIAATKTLGGQNRGDFISTNMSYLQQSMELSAGEDNDGVRLALYFRRMASGISSAYDLLGDPALTEVFRTSFGYPASMAQMDITRQAAIVNSKLSIKDLQDPAKLEKFLARFTAMYDIAQNSSGNSASALQILSGR